MSWCGFSQGSHAQQCAIMKISKKYGFGLLYEFDGMCPLISWIILRYSLWWKKFNSDLDLKMIIQRKQQNCCGHMLKAFLDNSVLPLVLLTSGEICWLLYGSSTFTIPFPCLTSVIVVVYKDLQSGLHCKGLTSSKTGGLIAMLRVYQWTSSVTYGYGIQQGHHSCSQAVV